VTPEAYEYTAYELANVERAGAAVVSAATSTRAVVWHCWWRRSSRVGACRASCRRARAGGKLLPEFGAAAALSGRRRSPSESTSRLTVGRLGPAVRARGRRSCVRWSRQAFNCP